MYGQTGATEAALLYARAPDLTAAHLEPLAATLARAAGTTSLLAADAPGLLRMVAERFEIRIGTHRTRLPAALTDAALKSRFTAVRPNDYAERVRRHEGYLALSVRPLSETSPGTEVVVAHLVLLHLIDLVRPEAILWAATGALFLPEEIPPADGLGFPSMLVLNPDIRMDGTDPRGRRRYGFTVGGSREWFGRTVVVEPTSHPLPETLAFVDLCLVARLSGEDILASEGDIPIDAATLVSIRHKPPGRVHPEGHVALSFHATRPMDRIRPAIPKAPVPRSPAPTPQPLHARGPRRDRPAMRG
jgi:hypothetical protein